MFASGRWVGYWTAEPALEDPMQNVHDLRLSFTDGGVDGGGVDMVGDFVMSGRASGDAVRIEKSYIGAHTVLYEGKRDDKGCIAGRWRIAGDGGGHFLWVPPGVDDPTPLAEAWYREVKRSRYRVAPAEKAPGPPQGKGCLGAVLVAAAIVVLLVGGV